MASKWSSHLSVSNAAVLWWAFAGNCSDSGHTKAKLTLMSFGLPG
jgi:hypothetical protein